ncbi:MAG: AAA family ATPase [Candidatus Nezhaarchaeota archaeon]|nr:AAA family ATPase [Candidatus Nezhaarchaeota archaeon]
MGEITVAASELERLALKYAEEAMKSEREGFKGKAIEGYSKAAEILLKLVKLYPNYPLNKIYIERALMYQERVKQIQMGLSCDQMITLNSVNSEELNVYEGTSSERPNVSWNDVIGLDEIKEEIRKVVVLPTRVEPEKLPLGWPTGILLFGPPGCGKTLIVAALASELNAHFFHIDPAIIMSKWLGESERNVAKVFEAARKNASRQRPSIIFIDEVEALTGIYSNEVGGEARMRSQLLKEMDGLHCKGKKHYVYVIGATNKPWILDQAFLRRFQKRIYVPPPDYKARMELFKHYTRGFKLAKDVDFELLAQKTEGYTSHDIEEVCREVQFKLIEDCKDLIRGELREACMKDFLEVMSKRRPSVSKELIRKYVEWNEKYGAI